MPQSFRSMPQKMPRIQEKLPPRDGHCVCLDLSARNSAFRIPHSEFKYTYFSIPEKCEHPVNIPCFFAKSENAGNSEKNAV